MKDYKGLTVKRADGEPTVRINITIQVLINRLAELEDKIESGTLIELPCKVGDMIYNKNIKFYLNSKEIPFEELSKLPQMTTDRENHTTTEIVLHYIDKDAIFFCTKTEHYTVVDGADEEHYGET